MPGTQITHIGINARRSASTLILPNLLGAEGLWCFNIADQDIARMNLIPGKTSARVVSATAPALTGLSAQFIDGSRYYDTDIVEAAEMTFMAIAQFGNRALFPVLIGNRNSPDTRGGNTLGVNITGLGTTQIGLSIGTTNAAGDGFFQETAALTSTLTTYHLVVCRYKATSIRVDNLSENTTGTNASFAAGTMRNMGTRPFRIGSFYNPTGSNGTCSLHTLGVWSRYLSDGEMNETAKAMGQIAVEDAVGYVGPSYS